MEAFSCDDGKSKEVDDDQDECEHGWWCVDDE